jgi:macrolide transport system ATP-binding/permease protein
MLQARLLTKHYGHIRAVREASFAIRPGEILGFLGANGAGKTTTIKMLTGLIEPSEGQILYDGRSIYEDLASYQRRLGYVPEEAYLYPHLSGREYLQLVGRLRGMPRNVLEPKLDELLKIFALWDDRFAALSSYSKGMRQKILLSAALIHNPDVLILDEPFSGLDVTSALMLRRLLSGLAERGKIVLYSSHVLEVVEKVCSKVLILRNGEVVAYDSIDQLRQIMQQPSLEGVFAQLVDTQGDESSADRILQVVTRDTAQVQPQARPSREGNLVPLGRSVAAREGNIVRRFGTSAMRSASKYLADLGHDVKRSLRTLAASPGFTVVALLSLSMGICIAACAFSEMNGMVLRNLPVVSKPDELVALEWPATYPEYKRYRERNEVFSSAAAYIAPVPFTVAFGGHKERTWGHLVSSSYFSTLGVRPSLGRLFGAAEEKPGIAPEVVVSHRFWQEQLGRDSAIVGKTLQVNGSSCTIIGVGAKDFLGASPALYVADLWIPVTVGSKLAPELKNDVLERNDLALFHVVGRLQAGVGAERAEAELNVVARQLELENNVPSNLEKSRRITLSEGGKLLPLRKQELPFFTSFFLIVAGLVMLIACANVANMALARGTQRRREIAVRLALGAGRGRLVRLLGTESMLIAAGAGIVGFAMSTWFMNLSSHLRMPFPMPVSYDLRPDWRVLLLTLGITTLAGFGFGLIPAMRATQGDLVPALKEGGNVLLNGFPRLTLRNLLMTAQIAGSLTLLVILGLLSFGIQTTLGIEAGFNPRGLYLVSLDPIRDGYSGDQSTVFLHKLLDRVKALPSVTAATLTESVPVSLGVAGLRFTEPSSVSNNSHTVHDAIKNIVGTYYFDTAGIPILQGRDFRREDENNDSSVVIVSEELVREYWPGENPVGRRIEIDNAQAFPAKIMPGSVDYRPAVSEYEPRSYEVVGVARDVANDLIINKRRPAVYFPLRNSDLSTPSLQGITLMVRAAPGSNALEILRREISDLDANVVPFHARSMNEQIAEFMAPLRSAAWTYGVIGIFGVVLASVGLAGMTAYSVAQRRREIGIRMALGARKGDVVRTVMKDGALLIAAGTSIGLACAWAGSRMLSAINSSVQQVTTTRTSNPVVLFGAPLLLAFVALLACYLPARKSSRINPLQVLHED